MLHNPKKQYSGLTIIVDKASRFDIDSKRLFSGWAGMQYENFLYPISLDSCQLRTLDETSNILEGTKAVLGMVDGCRGSLFSNDYVLNEIRGYPLNYQGLPMICTYAYQDAYDRKNYDKDDETDNENEGESSLKGHGKTRRRNRRWWAMQDIARAIKLTQCNGSDLGIGRQNNYIKHIGLNINNAIGFLHLLKGKKLFIDIETDKNKNLTCIGFGGNIVGDEVFVIPWKKYNNTLFYSDAECRRFIQTLIIAMNNNTVVVHNGMFDLFVLCYYYKVPFPKTKIIDTMVCWHRTYPELEKSLGHLLSYLTFLPYHKSEGIFNPKSPEDDRQLWNYNANDIIAMMELLPNLEKEMFAKGSTKSAEFACSMIRPYLTMMLKGMRLDVNKMLARFQELDFKKEQLGRCLNVVTERKLNPRSPKQVNEYLYNFCKHECLDEEAPTNEKTLLKLLTKEREASTIPSVRLILASRGVGKMASSLKFNLYCNRVTEEYNRATCAYNLCGTDTYRLSSKALLKFRTDKGFGTNMQNWDKSQRDLIIADEGKILIQIDQSGAEALIVAYLCRPGLYRDLFECGIKVHSFVALHVFKEKWIQRLSLKYEKFIAVGTINRLCSLKPKELKQDQDFKEVFDLIKDSDEWEAKERYYFIAKMICHASNYDMKAPTFQMNVLQKSEGAINLSIRECNEFLGLYHSLFPEIREWHERIKRELKKTRLLYNLFNEPRRFFEQEGQDLWKQGYAFIPQSTVGEITNRAVVRLQNYIESNEHIREQGFDLLQNGHDSILSQCNNNDSAVRNVIFRLKDEIEENLISPYDNTPFQMKSEISIGFNWAPYKKDKNDLGMQTYKI